MGSLVRRITGADMYPQANWHIGGCDLGIPYVLENGSIGYLFGDTFDGPWPGGPGWRSPVMMRSAMQPSDPGFVFDSAARTGTPGYAQELCYNQHDANSNHAWGQEFSVIPNDGISFPETGRQIISFQSIWSWNAGPNGSSWTSNYSSYAYSDNGNDFYRLPNFAWWNNQNNDDPYQMVSMQRDPDGYVYLISVRAGRQYGPMMLRRVPWDQMFDMSAYQGWGWNGSDWGWGRPCSGILWGRFGEPSLRRLADGTWVMSYANPDYPWYLGGSAIVTRHAGRPDAVWSSEKPQQFSWQQPSNYGGFIHPWSTTAPNGLYLTTSRWTRDAAGNTNAYDVSLWNGSVL